MHPLNLLAPLALLISASCAQNKPASSVVAEEYPLPSVSSAITDPHERASTICARFWDAAVFPAEDVPADSVSPALEQAMANFAAIASMASSPDSVRVGVSQMLRKGGIDRVMPLAERYLYDPNSPVRSEETFIVFLEAAPEWERTPLLLPQALKNRIGSPAADFPFVDSKGKKSSLYEFLKHNGETLVYFFDSECNVCKELIPLAKDAAQGRPVLAVCPQANSAAFTEVLPLFPAEWTIAKDIDQIDSEELYIFPALPSAYIISADGTVLVKDLPL